MMRDKFNMQLDELYEKLVLMGTLCQNAIALAVRTLGEEGAAAKELEYRVLEIDSRIDDIEREIEALCTKLILKQQPVAGDLLCVTAALKMITDLERIGDQAADIAELSTFIVGAELLHLEHLGKMAEETIYMVKESVRSFVEMDLALARSVIAYDDVVDDCFQRIKAVLAERIAADSSRGEEYLDILMVAKYLERIADHATNVAEWVEYAKSGNRSKNGQIYKKGGN